MKQEDIIVQGNIHVDDAGNSYLVQDNKITGVNPSYPLKEVIVDRFTPVTAQKLQVLGYDVNNKGDIQRLKDWHYKDGKIDWNSFDIKPWQAAQLQNIKNPQWRQIYGMTPDINTFNAITGGIFNQLSPTQFGRNIFNAVTGVDNWRDQFVFGNNGLFSDQFAENHPILTMTGNIAGDILTFGVRPQFSNRTIRRVSVPRTAATTTTSNQRTLDLSNIFRWNGLIEKEYFDKPVQKLISQFQKDRSMTKLMESAKSLTPEQQKQVNLFIRTHSFQAKKIPYYKNTKDLREAVPNFEEEYSRMNSFEQAAFDNLEDAFLEADDGTRAIVLKNPEVWDHEAEHWLQNLRKDLGYNYSDAQSAALHDAYTTEHPLLRDSELLVEKGATNQQLRTAAIKKFQEQYGRYPQSVEELRDFIDNIPDKQLKKTLSQVSQYGEDYISSSKLDMRKVRKAMKYIPALALGVNEIGRD